MKAKEACKVIEKCRYRILHLRELRQLRKLLGTLPYEARASYFKLIAVKKEQSELVGCFANYMADTYKINLQL